MSTRVTVVIADAPPELARQGFDAAFQVFEGVERTMNEWRPESPLGRVNASAGALAPVAAPAELCEVVRASLDGARRTGGLFDPTWAALRDLWRFGGDAAGKAPSEAAVRERCPLVSWARVELSPGDGGACRVRLPRAGMKLGLGGVAKGWGVDRAVAKLRALGLPSFYVQAGGDLYAAGRRGDRPWRIGVRDPRGPPDRFFARLEITDAAFSTSGDYERFFFDGGRRYHHVIDPRTCFPATATRSVTVLAKSALDAEFLTKAAFILGGEEGLALTERWGASAVIVTADNRVLASKGLAGKLEQWAPTP